MAVVVLHQWEISPFCGKIRKVLDFKHIEYSTTNYTGAKSPFSILFAAISSLPILRYDGLDIRNSAEIARFLERRHPTPSLYPAEKELYAQAKVFEDWADDNLFWYSVYFRYADQSAFNLAMNYFSKGHSSFERFLMSHLVKYRLLRKLKQQGIGQLPHKVIEEKFFERMRMLDGLLSKTGWLVGDQQSIADIAVSAQLDEIIRTSTLKDHLLSFSNIKDWLIRLSNKSIDYNKYMQPPPQMSIHDTGISSKREIIDASTTVYRQFK